MDTLSHHDARATLRSLGVADEAMLGGTPREWTGLCCELDRFFAFGYGAATQRRFLHEPHPGLGMRTPVEVLTQQDGIAQVRLAVRETLSALRA